MTQLTKGMPVIRRIPTRLWSYLTALAVMLCALVFNGTPSPSQILLTCFHAAVVALAANGGYDAAAQVLGGGKTEK